MRDYEVLYIIDPNTTDDGVPAVMEKFSKLISDQGGEVTSAELWDKGRRMLAYPIAGHKEGIYVLMHFKSAMAAPLELDRVMRIDEAILRHLVTRTDVRQE